MKGLGLKLLRFAKRVFTDFFFRNNGLMLTSAVAYNTMLSLVPLSAVLVVFASRFFEEDLLLETVTGEIGLIAPSAVPLIHDVLTTFIEAREVAGWIGMGFLLFFSSMAFRVLENAIAQIFHRPLKAKKRKFWVSALLPYGFIALTAVALIALTAMAAFFDARLAYTYELAGMDFALQQIGAVVLRFAGWLGLVLLFTTLYTLMPVARVSFRLALSGGVTAAVLWEGLRYVLTGYFTHISLVNVVYGSMATTIVALLTIETASLIVLLGAQVIADLQRSRVLGRAWYEDPEE